MQQVTDRIWKVTDDAGKERLVKGVDAREIEAVAKGEMPGAGGSQSDLIAEADRMLKAQEERAKIDAKRAKASESDPDVEGVTTTPEDLLKSNEPDLPRNEELMRESQNNPVRYEGDAPKETTFPADFPKDFPGTDVFRREGISFSRVQNMSREELLGVKGVGEATADAVRKFKSTGTVTKAEESAKKK